MQVEITDRDSARLIRINRPHRENRLSASELLRIADAVDIASHDDAVTALVITGTDGFFCSGGQVDGFADGDVNQQTGFARSYAAAARAFDASRVPVVAAVNGECHALGMSLLLSADLAVSADTATFGYPEISAGLFPMLAMAHAVRSLPRKVAFELFYEGRLLSAQEALQFHLLNDVVPAERLWEAVDARLTALAAADRKSVALGRGLYNALAGRGIAEDTDLARGALLELLAGRNATGSAWA